MSSSGNTDRPVGWLRRGAGAALSLGHAVAALLLLGGAAHAGTVEVPLQIGGAFTVRVTSLQEARFAAVVRQQYDFSCGSAALSTLLRHHYGHPVTEQQVFDEMFRRGDSAQIARAGFSLLDMKTYLQAHGFEADGFEAPLASLVQAGVPAIALINERGYNHFVVIKGLQGGRVLLGDPAGGTRAMPQAAFEALRANDILFVISNQQERARFNTAADWRTAPPAPLGGRDGFGGPASGGLPKLGASDF